MSHWRIGVGVAVRRGPIARRITIQSVAFLALAVAATGCAWLRDAVIFWTPCATYSQPSGAAKQEPPVPPGAREIVAPRCDLSHLPPPDFVAVQRILTRSCGTAGACHLAGSASEAGLDFASVDTYRELVHDADGASRCTKELGIQKRVVPWDVSRSMLFHLITGSDCGAHMPFGGAYLSCDAQATITGWIQGGAPPPATRDMSPSKHIAFASPPPGMCPEGIR
jgi:hypothetical protein